MSYPGYPQDPGFSGEYGMPKPGFQIPHPSYVNNSADRSGYPMPNAYPPSQPGYPTSQPSYPTSQPGYPTSQPGYPTSQPGYPQQSSHPPQYPPQKPTNQFQHQSGTHYPNSSQYTLTNDGRSFSASGQYPPRIAPYPNTHQPPSSFIPQSAYLPAQQVPYGGGSQTSSRADYSRVSTPAYYQPPRSSPDQKMSNPTVRPANQFDPRRDAELLRKAMKGFGTDEKVIIQVLTQRVNSQRQEIALHFKTMYGKDLISDLKSELSGRFEDLVIALMTPIYDFLAKEIHHAVKGIGTNEETIIEILCTASNAEIYNIKTAYHKLFGKDMEKDLMGDTSGYFRRLLVSLCQGRRSENTFVDVTSAQADAHNLLQAGEMRLGTDESTFNMILCSRSYCQLQQVFLEYHRLTGRDFEDVIKSEFSGDIENGLRAIVKSVRDKSAYFAKCLHESMAGFGTNDRALIRIVATRCEIDMVEIKNAYMSMYGKALETDIAGDTSGDYKKCLLSLVAG